ncbi:MAG: AAA family ATPase, partial [SAR324 cluster bacterium]|nr:AAA family ATPase [SAR324 cluster bacterium]
IIFIDEIDAVGRSRGAGLGGGNDEREQTLNQLLVEMDGFSPNEGVIVVAATNRPDVLDPALLRPGRFDRHVVVPTPDINGREKILASHAENVELSKDIDLRSIARGTPGFTGADLANLVNEAALWAARNNKKEVESQDFEYAKDKVLMGSERRTLLITEEEKKTTAYHEAGHALVAATIEEVDPVHKVTIIPRGRALGVTQLLPEEDRHSFNEKTLLGQIAMIMGGRAAEDLIFSRFTTGASDDLKKATDIARKMVCQWGMSNEMGPVSYTENPGQVFLGRDLQRHKGFSNESTKMIDKEVRRILGEAYQRAKQILTDNKEALEKVTLKLLEQETIDGETVLQC